MSEATDFGSLSPSQGEWNHGYDRDDLANERIELGLGSVDKEERKRLRKKRVDKLAFDSSAGSTAKNVLSVLTVIHSNRSCA